MGRGTLKTRAQKRQGWRRARRQRMRAGYRTQHRAFALAVPLCLGAAQRGTSSLPWLKQAPVSQGLTTCHNRKILA